MTDYTVPSDYKARSEQWEDVELRAGSEYSTDTCVLELLARVQALEAANSKPTPNPSQIRSSLVERVQRAIGHTFPPDARAAIREVAAWLREQSPAMHRSNRHWADCFEQEAGQ